MPEGWERARSAGEPCALGWRVEDVARFYRERWPRFLAAVEGPEPLGVNHEVPAGVPVGRILEQNAILAFAYAVVRAANGSAAGAVNGSAPLSVLDWAARLATTRCLRAGCCPEIELD